MPVTIRVSYLCIFWPYSHSPEHGEGSSISSKHFYETSNVKKTGAVFFNPSVINHGIDRIFSHIFICNEMSWSSVERSVFHREQAAVSPKVCTKLPAQDREGSRSCPAVCMCKAVQTGVSTVVQGPQFQVSSLSDIWHLSKLKGKGKGVDHIVTVSVRLEIRIWAFHFVKNDMLPSPVQICSHQLLVKASSEVSQISQDMWIYDIHSSSPCWDKVA